MRIKNNLRRVSMLEVGVKAPEFSLPNQDGAEISLKDLKGSWVVLYFYPKDNTPGCTTEACEFSAQKPLFDDMDAIILGVSPDSIKKHNDFIEKQHLKITLLSDESKEMMKAYGAFGTKKLYGKDVVGVIRSTFIINPDGDIAYVWKSVKAKGHAESVKKRLEELQKRG